MIVDEWIDGSVRVFFLSPLHHRADDEAVTSLLQTSMFSSHQSWSN